MTINADGSAAFEGAPVTPLLQDYQRVLYSFVGRKFFGLVTTTEDVEEILLSIQRRIEN